MRTLSNLFLILLTSVTLTAEPSWVDWMPRVEDQTGLWWVNGPTQMFQRPERTKEEILVFQFGKQTMLFDTRRVRPVEGEWECAVIAEGWRFVCNGHTQPEDEWQQPNPLYPRASGGAGAEGLKKGILINNHCRGRIAARKSGKSRVKAFGDLAFSFRTKTCNLSPCFPQEKA